MELLLVALPFTTPVNDGLNRQAVVNGVRELAAQWDVPYVNLMYRLDEMGFDFSQDMADMYHLNWRGWKRSPPGWGGISPSTMTSPTGGRRRTIRAGTRR